MVRDDFLIFDLRDSFRNLPNLVIYLSVSQYHGTYYFELEVVLECGPTTASITQFIHYYKNVAVCWMLLSQVRHANYIFLQ